MNGYEDVFRKRVYAQRVVEVSEGKRREGERLQRECQKEDAYEFLLTCIQWA